MDPADITRNILMYIAGFADYLCHRAAHIEQTSGVKESILHLLQFVEMGIPILAAMFLEINALVILVMIVFFFFHEVTALLDLSYASATRKVGPIEQPVHSFLEMLPLMGLLMIIVLYWPQFVSLLGFTTTNFELRLKQLPLPWTYVATMLTWSSYSRFCRILRNWYAPPVHAEKHRTPSFQGSQKKSVWRLRQCESLASFGENTSALLSRNFLPFLACLGKCNGDRLFAAFHLASLAAAPALSTAAFVAVDLAANFLTRATGILSSALLSHSRSPLPEPRWSTGIYRAWNEN